MGCVGGVRFTFIILMQRMKMVHQRKLEAARELYGLSPTDEIAEEELKMKAKERLDFRKVDGLHGSSRAPHINPRQSGEITRKPL